MKIIAIRHGQTKLNAEGRVQGRSDYPLDEVGRKQAKKIISFLPEDVDAIFTSPLRRATETAEIINENFGVTMFIDHRLIERNFGDYEGELIAGLEMNKLRSWTDNAYTPNGETIRDVAKRVFDFLDTIKQTYDGKTILVVAHSHVLRPISWYFNGIPIAGKEVVLEIKTGEALKFLHAKHNKMP